MTGASLWLIADGISGVVRDSRKMLRWITMIGGNRWIKADGISGASRTPLNFIFCGGRNLLPSSKVFHTVQKRIFCASHNPLGGQLIRRSHSLDGGFQVIGGRNETIDSFFNDVHSNSTCDGVYPKVLNHANLKSD